MPEFHTKVRCKCNPARDLCDIIDCHVSYWYLTNKDIADSVKHIIGLVRKKHDGPVNKERLDIAFIKRITRVYLKGAFSWRGEPRFSDYCVLKTWNKTLIELRKLNDLNHFFM